ncbi:MAG: Shikimate kinase [Bacteroidota bacterium]|jgi:shikimate kinase
MQSSVIYLIGFSTSGKSTLGKIIAEKLNYQFIDLDEAITQQQGKSINALFDEFGEEGFRKTERQLLVNTIFLTETVIACGGGTPCYSDNMDFLLRNGITIYLEVDESVLLERMLNNTAERPLFKGKSKEEISSHINELLTARKVFYERANYTVNNNSNEELAIISILKILE